MAVKIWKESVSRVRCSRLEKMLLTGVKTERSDYAECRDGDRRKLVQKLFVAGKSDFFERFVLYSRVCLRRLRLAYGNRPACQNNLNL